MTSTGAVTTSAVRAVTEADGHPFVAQFRRFAEEVLRPAAIETDRTDVPTSTIQRLAEPGALNHLAPPEYGGAGLDAAADRRLSKRAREPS